MEEELNGAKNFKLIMNETNQIVSTWIVGQDFIVHAMRLS